MNNFLFLFFVLFSFLSFSQYAPVPGQFGSTAIYKDSSCIVSWATNVEIVRGYLDINDKSITIQNSNKVTFGSPSEALGQAEGNATNCISLGDSGIATLTFGSTIFNGLGPDFVIFENGFADNYLELAFVEVSSDGQHFVRFLNSSLYPYSTQVGPFSYANCEKVNNLAGKYRVGYGTPFDLQELSDSANIDINHISHIRIIDVIGSISEISSHDSEGNIINDCYPTAFASGGFDLDGVGVMYLNNLGINELESNISIYPNPSTGIINLNLDKEYQVEITDVLGNQIYCFSDLKVGQIDLSSLSTQIVLVSIKSNQVSITKRILIQ
ncbi:MAG: T9SS type A sorting domain-containing protein [Flavobacteriia bacterium]|nr:T9SS type A sorting domain-containing protein [Flavobacteriia bacterium]